MLLSIIPLTITGLGQDPYTISGLFLGLMIPVLFVSWYIDNIAVCEETKIKETFKRSTILCVSEFFATFVCILISCISFFVIVFLGILVWGMILADRFTQYQSMNMTALKETFSGFTLSDWQTIFGQTGMIATAVICGFIIFLTIPFILVFKYHCYRLISDMSQVISGGYDEKGRWYKY